ncbi:unnamed protein product [marine sediment metagenome]|uniref:Uncharacterized protein n=1 Tax=marine sediment metagenome TaxID=412755 RepID=X1MP05_9ZZZZ
MAGNKHLKKTIVILCAAIVVFTLVGCRKEAPTEDSEDETTAGPNETLVVELGVGIGPVKFGMSKEEVIENFGEPDKVEGGGQGLNYVASKGFSLFVSPMRGVRAIDCWSEKYPVGTVSNFAGKTKEGIAMNASRAEIVAAYGKPDRTTSNGPMTTLHYGKFRAQFVIMHDKLVNLKMNAPK